MAGIAMVPLTEKELARLLAWHEIATADGLNTLADDELAQKLRENEQAVACRVFG